MTANELLKSAKSTAKVFHAEFPNELPSLEWLAEAAAIDRIPDEQREEWEQAVRDQVKEVREPQHLAESTKPPRGAMRVVVRRTAFLADLKEGTIRPAGQRAARMAGLGHTPDTTEEMERAKQLRAEVLSEVRELVGEPGFGWNWVTLDGHSTYPLGG